jgi:hypothetical protein
MSEQRSMPVAIKGKPARDGAGWGGAFCGLSDGVPSGEAGCSQASVSVTAFAGQKAARIQNAAGHAMAINNRECLQKLIINDSHKETHICV